MARYNPRRPLTSGEQPRSYRACSPPPPYSHIPQPHSYISPSHSYTSPPRPHNPPPRPYAAPPRPYASPPRPYGLPPPAARSPPIDGSFQKRVSKATIFGWIAVILFQVLLMTTHIDVLEPWFDVQSAKRHASKENSTLVVEKGKMESEMKAMTHEKELWEKAKEDRVLHGAFWEDVLPARDCRAYGEREYWGVLRNIPEGWSGIDACMKMPVEIKDVTIKRPYRCGYIRGSPHVHGYWMVDWDQPECKPWFRDYQDAGCAGYRSGQRKIEAEMVGINKKQGDWKLLCNSTPLIWNLIKYTSPTHCEERRWGRKVATWNVPDEDCL